ncbi:MAG: hypothetical protein ACJ741_15720 [Pyrinomonadaceae bacterium]
MRKLPLCLLLAALGLLSLSPRCRAQSLSFDSDRWDVHARESKVVDYLGRRSLLLKGGEATLKDSRFMDGVIEFDMAFSPTRTFMGVVWREQDFDNCEHFYIRPHQSGNPDANQYEPVFNGMDSWQLYYGEAYSAPVKYDFDQWVHFKIVVSGRQAEIYIKDMETPALFVAEQKREPKAGVVGLRASSLAPAYYSNFSLTPMDRPPALKGKPKATQPAPAGMVMAWAVSDAFDGKTLEKKYQLAPADTEKLKWQRLGAEATGIANLARLRGVTDAANTVFARLRIHSDREQVKRLRFGFSDAVKAYFNGRLIYGGSDIYASRDYRFLGTVGLFDELYLPLRKGDNELLLAVTENFGGWGVEAAFDEMDGISLKD